MGRRSRRCTPESLELDETGVEAMTSELPKTLEGRKRVMGKSSRIDGVKSEKGRKRIKSELEDERRQ